MSKNSLRNNFLSQIVKEAGGCSINFEERVSQAHSINDINTHIKGDLGEYELV